jgi:4,5:9,10-diseco-3-hydroxy-5,9,17-trioxoandrosta-1(10),2-diene-4-oate hydrolase
VELTAEATSRFVQAGGVRIHYHEAGEGPVLLAIHGGAPGAYGWGNFGQNLPALSQYFRTLIVDLPGYGRSDKPAVEGGRFGFYAATFRDMLKTLGIEQCHILGLATGGAVALTMALQTPELVDRLVVVNSAGGISLFQPSPSEGLKIIQGYYGGDGPSRAKMRSYLEMIIYDRSSITEELIDDRYRVSVDPEFMAQAPEGHADRPAVNEPIWQDLHKVNAKTLVVWGRDNRVIGFDAGLYMLARIPDVQLHVFGKAGLWVPWEKAKDFNREVIGFLMSREDDPPNRRS